MMAATRNSAPPIAVGQGAESSEAGNLEGKSSTGSANEPAACQCRINPSGCLICRRWSKRIQDIEARRANSLRRQALGNLMRGAI